jgi:para-nitrobenzyl esterase
LLAGWNADEGSYHSIFGKDAPTSQNFAAHARKTFGDDADQFLKLYPATDDKQAKRSAQDLAGDQFIAYSTWKWLEMQRKTGDAPVYRYRFEEVPPMPQGSTEEPRGAYHSAEIEFVFGVLSSKHLPWRPEDLKLSQLMSTYWSNFAKTGDPNGPGLPKWPRYSSEDGYQLMQLNSDPGATKDPYRDRYEFLDRRSRFK